VDEGEEVGVGEQKPTAHDSCRSAVFLEERRGRIGEGGVPLEEVQD
jgi:hypothetical protein